MLKRLTHKREEHHQRLKANKSTAKHSKGVHGNAFRYQPAIQDAKSGLKIDRLTVNKRTMDAVELAGKLAMADRH